MTIRIAIDLEMHNDGGGAKCGDIIQLGYCIFSTERGMLETSGDYIVTGQPLSPYITSLTGITEDEITRRGVSIHKAYHNMLNTWNRWVEDGKLINEPAFAQICEWGSGDVSTLRNELSSKAWEDMIESYHLDSHQEVIAVKDAEVLDIPKHYIRNNYEWMFGEATLNLKAVYQMYRISRGQNRSGGLSKALKNLGLNFLVFRDEVAPGSFRQRGKHDARADALSTASLYLELDKRTKHHV